MIDRQKVMNALDTHTIEELGELAASIAMDDSIKVVVVTGAGEKAFVAGADIGLMKSMTSLQARRWATKGKAALDSLENLPQPVIAAISGYCLGGGLELALACDLRVTDETGVFGLPEVTLGVIPGFGGTQRLVRVLGAAKGKEMLFLGNRIDAVEALRIGLVNRMAPKGEALAIATKIAEEIAANASVAVQLCKTCANKGVSTGLNVGQTLETESFGVCFSTDDQQEGMQAFLEKRRPIYCGR